MQPYKYFVCNTMTKAFYMVCGVLSAKEMLAEKRVPRYFRSPWQREQRTGESIKSTDKEEKAKKIYQGAFAIPVKKRNLAKVEAEVEEAAIKTKEVEIVEVEEKEAKNQKTLADFF